MKIDVKAEVKRKKEEETTKERMRDIKNKQISNVHHNIITEQIYIELYFC
jgi:hypothetical protein